MASPIISASSGFGAIRPVTHRVGEWILRGDYEQAVLTYIGMEFPGERESGKRDAVGIFCDP
jgi:tRNA(Glu) U13 pseudouridine synthase TruD